MEFKHISVLLNESIDLLKVKPDGVYADGTLGGGGHSSLICSRLSEDGMLIGIDRDETALAAAGERLQAYSCRKELCHENFFNIRKVLNRLNIDKIDGAILDLGVSSPQLDVAERGFSYNSCARLDMRMDRSAELDAYKVVNTYDEKRLADIIFGYGEEKFSRRIARAICAERKVKPIETTTELSDIIKSAIPPAARYADKHPAKRTFQAIRIEVNGELLQLSSLLENIIFAMNENGRIAIITFHSLEDRLVKNAFSKLQKPCTCPPEFPVCVCGKRSYGQVVGKVITATEEEIARNPRSRSAKLRVFEKKTDLNQRRKIFE